MVFFLAESEFAFSPIRLITTNRFNNILYIEFYKIFADCLPLGYTYITQLYRFNKI